MLHKTKLNKVFAELRKMGFVARQHYWCCSGCAGCAISYEFAEKAAKDPSFNPKGFVYYHKQDTITEREIRGSKYRTEPPSQMIRFGHVEFDAVNFKGEPLPEKKSGKWGLDDAEIGKMVCRALDAVGMEYKWDGNPDVCIEIFPYGKTKERGVALNTNAALLPPGVAA